MQKVLARVEKAYIEIEDHGILTGWVSFEKEDGFHQSFGGLGLDTYDKDLDERVGHAAGTGWILEVLKVFGASKLEDIAGKMCYALYEPEGETFSRTISGIQALEMDGGRKFLVKDWQNQYFTKEELSDNG